MKTFRKFKIYKVLALFLLVVCVIGPTISTYATTGEGTLTTQVNTFTNMSSSGLIVEYSWTDNDTSTNTDYGAYGNASAANDVITCQARGWDDGFGFSNYTTLILTMRNGSGVEKTLEFTLTEITVGESVEIQLNGVAQEKSPDGKYSFLLVDGAECTVILTTKVDATTMNEIQISNMRFYGQASATDVLTVIDAPDGTAFATPPADPDASSGTVSGLAVTYADDYRFIGWKNAETDSIVSTNESSITNISGSMTVYPFCVPKEYPVLQVGTTLYYYWEDAFQAAVAGSDKTVIVYKMGDNASATLPAQASRNKLGDYVKDTDGDGMVTYEIPTGCNLLLPYSGDDTGCFGALSKDEQATTDTPSTYFTLTLAYGAKMICNGQMNVNGQRDEVGQQYSGGPMGAHGLLILDGTGTQLTVNGTLSCYGFIAGTGRTEVNGTIYEMLQMADFAGGTFSSGWSTAAGVDNPEVFLLTQYYVQNVESPLRINSTATAKVVSVIEVQSTKFNEVATFVGSDGLFVFGEGNPYVERTIGADERVEYVLGGGTITFGSIGITFKLLGLSYPINSSDHVLPVPSLMTVRVADGASVSMANAMAILPGGQVIVDAGCSLTLTNKLFVFDKADWSHTHFYQGGATKALTPVYYNTTRKTTIPASVYNQADKSALLEINGTLTVSSTGGLFTTTGGSNTDKVLCGTGTIVVNSSSLNFTTDYDSSKDSDVKKNETGIRPQTNILYVGYATQSVKVGQGKFIFYYDLNRDFITSKVTVSPIIANYAGKGEFIALPSTGTYHGVIKDGKNYWYTDSVVISNATCAQSGVTRYHCGSYSANDESTYIEVTTPATGKHNWGNDCKCDDCGIFKFYATNINLGNDLDLMFAIPVGLRTDWSGCKVVFEYTDSDGNPASKTINYSAGAWPKRAIDDNGYSTTGTTYYVFTFGDFAAKEMCKEVTVTIYEGNTPITVPITTSIRDYALKALKSAQTQILELDPDDDGTADDSAKVGRLNELRYMRTMIVDMLNYGTACQIALDYPNEKPNETELANYGLTDAQKKFASTPLVLQAGAEPNNQLWAASELVTTSNIVYKIALNPDALKNATSVEYAFTGHKGNDVATTVAVSGLYSETINGVTYQYLRIQSMVVADAQCEITVKINYGDGSSKAFTESIEAYVNRMNQKTADGVYREFLEFAMVAKQYLQCKYNNMEVS